MNEQRTSYIPPNTLPEVEAELARVENEIAVIKAKLDSVRAKHHATGEYTDPDWYARAKTALRFKGVEHQILQRAHANLRVAAERQHQNRVEAKFIEIVRGKISAEAFAGIMAMALAEVGAGAPS